jgi:pimeloyl-ACP methyl ester carboxylesterase
VLRFDFRGCGDSEGDEAVAGTDAWRDDIGTAVEELKRRAGAARVALAGLRLGGTLAAQAAAGRDDVPRSGSAG